jgi:DNA primase
MLKLKLNLIVSIGLIFGALWLWWQEHQKRTFLEEQIIEKSKSIKPHTLNPVGVAIPRVEKVQATATATAQPTAQPLSPLVLYGIESRISAIENIIPLSEQQKSRLKDKFTDEALARQRGAKANTELLTDIIGEENSKFYQERLASAFKKSKEQELERDVFYFSRKLNFNSSQEQQVRQLFTDVESQVVQRFQNEKSSPQYAQDPSFRVRLMLQENNFRKEWLESELQKILSPEQYQAYLQEEADSAAAELNMWHAP